MKAVLTDNVDVAGLAKQVQLRVVRWPPAWGIWGYYKDLHEEAKKKIILPREINLHKHKA